MVGSEPESCSVTRLGRTGPSATPYGEVIHAVSLAAQWSILDCNATGDHRAVLATNQVGIYDIYVRILGKPGGHIGICADTLLDTVTGDVLCPLGTIDLTRGKGQSKFQIAPSSMFDASLFDILWTVDTNPAFRIVQ